MAGAAGWSPASPARPQGPAAWQAQAQCAGDRWAADQLAASGPRAMLRSGRCSSATHRCARRQTTTAKDWMAGRTPATDRSGATSRSRTSGRPPAAGRWCGRPSAASRPPAAGAAPMLAACAAGVRMLAACAAAAPMLAACAAGARTDRARAPSGRARAVLAGNVQGPEQAASTHAVPNSADREPGNREPLILACGGRVWTGENGLSAPTSRHRQDQVRSDRATIAGRQTPAGHCRSTARYPRPAPRPSSDRRPYGER